MFVSVLLCVCHPSITMPQLVPLLRAEMARLREYNAELQEQNAEFGVFINNAIGVIQRVYEDARDNEDAAVYSITLRLCLELADALKPGLMAQYRESFREQYGRYPEEAEALEPQAEPDIDDEQEPEAEPMSNF